MGKRILIEGLMHLGDLVASSAIIRPIRRKYPNSEITYLVTPGLVEAAKAMPDVDGVLIYEYKSGGSLGGVWQLSRRIKEGKYDIFISFDPRDRTAIAAWLGRVPVRLATDSVFGWPVNWVKQSFFTQFTALRDFDLNMHLTGETFLEGVHRMLDVEIYSDDRPVLHVPVNIFESILDRVNQSGSVMMQKNSYVCMCLSTVDKQRSWPIEHWVTTISYILQHVGSVILVGTKEDYSLASTVIPRLPEKFRACIVNFCGKTSLLELFAILQGARLTVNIDNGIGHIAAALCCPTVTLFPTQSPSRFLPMGIEAVAVTPSEDLGSITVEAVVSAISQYNNIKR